MLHIIRGVKSSTGTNPGGGKATHSSEASGTVGVSIDCSQGRVVNDASGGLAIPAQITTILPTRARPTCFSAGSSRSRRSSTALTESSQPNPGSWATGFFSLIAWSRPLDRRSRGVGTLASGFAAAGCTVVPVAASYDFTRPASNIPATMCMSFRHGRVVGCGVVIGASFSADKNCKPRLVVAYFIISLNSRRALASMDGGLWARGLDRTSGWSL
mmetsp:Transcript_76655/g.175813  ORF Transcript_76655/g.175813 Transcript_76655/m.175813 type:complete len:215 (-) Transcript_76655:34-678(-)